MRTRHFILVTCLFGVQCGLAALTITWQNTALGGLAGAAWYGSWLIPFVGYIAVLESAPLFAARARVLRAALLIPGRHQS